METVIKNKRVNELERKHHAVIYKRKITQITSTEKIFMFNCIILRTFRLGVCVEMSLPFFS